MAVAAQRRAWMAPLLFILLSVLSLLSFQPLPTTATAATAATAAAVPLSEQFAASLHALFRAGSRFPSAAEFRQEHLKSLAEQRQKLRLQSEARATFILRLPDDCGEDCQQTIRDRFQEADAWAYYRPINAEFAFITSFQQIADLCVAEGLFPEYTPLSPSLKVDPSIDSLPAPLSVDTADADADAAASASCGDLIVQIAAQTEEEFGAFLLSISSQISGLDIEYDGFAPGRQFYASVRVLPDSAGACSRAETVAALSQLSQVLWIEYKFPVVTLNRWARSVCQSGTGYNNPFYNNGNLTGLGEIVGVADTGIDMKNCYFYDPDNTTPFNRINLNHRKVVYYRTYADSIDDSEAHGTHVAGTVAGYSSFDYGDFKKYNGIAYNAKLAFFDIGTSTTSRSGTTTTTLKTPSNLNTDMFTPLYQTGARIFSNSWGVESTSWYTSMSESTDTFMWNNPDALVLYANGNNGASGSKTVNAPATYKNGLSVGASLNYHDSWLAYNGGKADSFLSLNSMAAFSSRGPTTDGRMKPDLLAPGWWTTSAAGHANSSELHCSIKELRGTSMATPTTAGMAALVREYFRNGYYPSGSPNPSDGFIPSGALIKAVLIHSAVAVDTIVDQDSSGNFVTTTIPASRYPSNDQGYGRIQLDRVLNFGASSTTPISLFVKGAAFSSAGSSYVALSSRNSHSYPFVASADADPIRVTMTFTDLPGTASTASTAASTPVMVNNLTVYVRDRSGTIYRPYITTTNVQVIDISNPQANSQYTAVVVAGTLSAVQPYALVITGKVTALNESLSESTDSLTSSSVSHIKDLGKARLTFSSIKYVIALGLIAIFLIALVRHIYRASKRTEEDFDIGENPSSNFNIFARLPGGSRNSGRSNNPPGLSSGGAANSHGKTGHPQSLELTVPRRAST